MKKRHKIFLSFASSIMILFSLPFVKGVSGESNSPTEAGGRLEKIIKGVEKRYNVSTFSAKFNQTSTIKVMAITDTDALSGS